MPFLASDLSADIGPHAHFTFPGHVITMIPREYKV